MHITEPTYVYAFAVAAVENVFSRAVCIEKILSRGEEKFGEWWEEFLQGWKDFVEGCEEFVECGRSLWNSRRSLGSCGRSL